MNNTVNLIEYSAPEYNLREIYRYLGVKDADEGITRLVEECITESYNTFKYKVCYIAIPIVIKNNEIQTEAFRTTSKNLSQNLQDCDEIIIFAATVGIGVDRLIARYSKINPSKAVCLQSIAAERIETLCDLFNKELTSKYNNEGYILKPRFSPGYGDLPLNLQKDLIRILDCQRKIGLTLTDGMLMIPSKSVTAVIGIKKGK